MENQNKHENVIAIWNEPMKKVQPQRLLNKIGIYL
jgi:hypothetical protein